MRIMLLAITPLFSNVICSNDCITFIKLNWPTMIWLIETLPMYIYYIIKKKMYIASYMLQYIIIWWLSYYLIYCNTMILHIQFFWWYIYYNHQKIVLASYYMLQYIIILMIISLSNIFQHALSYIQFFIT